MTIDPHVLRSKRKCKVRQHIYVSIVNRLPSEIAIEILSRLPIDSILQCRLVCKTWRKLLRHPSFAHVHSNQLSHVNGNSVIGGKPGFGFLFCFTFWPKYNDELYYGEYDDQSKKKLIRINQPPIFHHQI
ncbi:hypothetical protein MKX03_013664, partial [Papaver bracteatum]